MRINEINSRDMYDVLKYGKIIASNLDTLTVRIHEGDDTEIIAEEFLVIKQELITFDLIHDKELLQKLHTVNAEIIAAGGAGFLTETK